MTKLSASYLRRRNLQILLNNTTLIPFKWRGKYLCFYCGDDTKTPDRLRKHTKGHGPCSDRDRAIRLVKSADAEIKIDVSDVTCEICSESFPFLDEIIDHLIFKHQLPYEKDIDMLVSAYRLVDLQCLLCDKSFTFLSKLISHMNTDHPNNSFECSECKKTFNKKRDLDSHLRAHHKKYHACTKCGETFPTNSALQIHRSNAHSSTCNICFQVFSSDGKRLAHLKSDHDTEQSKCGFCNKVLTTKQAFIRHAANCEHKPKEETVVIDDEEKKMSVKEIRNSLAAIFNMTTALPFKFFMNRLRCFYCTRDFTTCEELKEHSLSEHPHCDISFKSMRLRNRYDGVQIKVDTSSLSCRLCHIELQDLSDLIDHLTKEHKVKCDMTVESNLQPFKLIKDNYPCPICGEVYRYFGLLLKHVSASHSGNKHICMYCGKAFRTDPNLRAHVSRRHKTADNHKCTNCDLQFPTIGTLRNHQGTVHGTKLVQCFECSEKFTSKYSMQRHLITSHGRGHKCTYCDKLFTKNSFMVNHVRRSHLKEKNVECSVCFERFFDRQRLKMHMVKHVGERNFHCDICGKKFLWKRNLRGHMASHIRNANARNVT